MYDYTNNITDEYIFYEQNNNNITYSFNNTNHRLFMPM